MSHEAVVNNNSYFGQENLYDRFAPRTGLVLSLICLLDVKLILMSHDSERFKRYDVQYSVQI